MQVNVGVGIPHRLALAGAAIFVVVALSAAAGATAGPEGTATMTLGDITITYACSRPADQQGAPKADQVECAVEVSKAGKVQARPVVTMLVGEKEEGTIRTGWKDQAGTLHELRIAMQFASTEAGTAKLEILRGGEVEQSQIRTLHVAPRP